MFLSITWPALDTGKHFIRTVWKIKYYCSEYYCTRNRRWEHTYSRCKEILSNPSYKHEEYGQIRLFNLTQTYSVVLTCSTGITSADKLAQSLSPARNKPLHSDGFCYQRSTHWRIILYPGNNWKRETIPLKFLGNEWSVELTAVLNSKSICYPHPLPINQAYAPMQLW